MIVLYQFRPLWGLLNASPFCMKLEVYLQLAKIPYQVQSTNNPRRAPKGKLPFIKDGDKVISDSTIIIDYLKSKYGDALDQGLTTMQLAEARAIQVLLEDHLYWAIVYSRWVDPDGWNAIKNTIFETMPRLMRAIVFPILRKKVKNTLYSQGIGRYSRDEIYALGKKDLAAVANLIYSQPFMFGNQPTSIDASIYAFLSSILYSPNLSPLKIYATQLPELGAYCERMKKFLFTTSVTA
jgi:glutathione S-transferase